ncbi:AraC family transcriptional regulator [Pseudidiomarina aestuarii]|uniref:AraC family transcriptional regulator n=1 Tax=Pseudidiomarina aestuarii TaxID=624146 RepID=A0A2T4D5G2_9GAMM|nr:AraC family transcriptional regulator [Pseudidiomarina aestuarii]PTB89249.1 AraC family transcriptional regulator [Pseudidiomarina aestuarii]
MLFTCLRTKLEHKIVNADVLNTMLQSAQLSLADLLEQLDMSRETTVDELTLVDVLRLLEQYAIAVHDESWHLSQRPLLPGTNDFVLAQLPKCKTLQDMLEQLAQSYNFIHGGNYNRVEVRQRTLVYVVDDADFPYQRENKSDYISFNLNCVLMYIHGIVCTLLEQTVPLVKVETKSTPTLANPLFSEFCETAIRYESNVYALHFPLEMATTELRWPADQVLTSAQVYQELQQRLHSSQDLPGSRFLQRVRTEVANGTTSQEQLASQLGCSVATLRRKLAAHSTSFRKVREHVLNQRAKTLLAQGLTLESIALQLGFSDSRSFSRAFKAWNGHSPNSH